jgi:hypothetical protein
MPLTRLGHALSRRRRNAGYWQKRPNQSGERYPFEKNSWGGEK